MRFRRDDAYTYAVHVCNCIERVYVGGLVSRQPYNRYLFFDMSMVNDMMVSYELRTMHNRKIYCFASHRLGVWGSVAHHLSICRLFDLV